MHRRRLAALSALALAALTLTATSALGASPKLTGTVGPGFSITFTQGGKKVTRLKAGTYTLVIVDKSPIHNFGLDGPRGFAKDFTSVSFTGTKRFTLTLKKGTYKYYCAPHESSMFGKFTVS